MDINDLKVVSYRRASAPLLSRSQSPEIINLNTHLADELRKLETSLATLINAAPQVANEAPEKPMKGMIRYAVSPWNPLGSGDAWVWFDGSAWVAFP